MSSWNSSRYVRQVRVRQKSTQSHVTLSSADPTTSNSTRLASSVPLDYQTPSFPGFYWPFPANVGVPKYLYYYDDIWRFTLLWTLIIFAVFHGAVALFAVAMQLGRGQSSWKYVWIIPLFYALIAGIEALLAGSVVGLM